MTRKQNPNELTPDEIAFLRHSDRVPEMVKRFVARQHDTVGLSTSAYEKVAAKARAERKMLWEIALLEITRAKAGLPAERSLPALVQEADLHSEVVELREELMRLQAQPAMVVNGGD